MNNMRAEMSHAPHDYDAAVHSSTDRVEPAGVPVSGVVKWLKVLSRQATLVSLLLLPLF